MANFEINLKFNRPGLHLITPKIGEVLKKILENSSLNRSGILHLFNPHTSCGLLINESFDPTAQADLKLFFDHLAPNDLPFITHTVEGEDDSPAHMKGALLNHHIALMVERGELILGRWQGVFLAEFRDSPPTRTLYLKYHPDPS